MPSKFLTPPMVVGRGELERSICKDWINHLFPDLGGSKNCYYITKFNDNHYRFHFMVRNKAGLVRNEHGNLVLREYDKTDIVSCPIPPDWFENELRWQ